VSANRAGQVQENSTCGIGYINNHGSMRIFTTGAAADLLGLTGWQMTDLLIATEGPVTDGKTQVDLPRLALSPEARKAGDLIGC
jgi:hypothetical protein